MNTHRIYEIISPWFRRPRMRRFTQALGITDKSHILDIGGTPFIWKDFELSPQITLLNADNSVEKAATLASMKWHPGDGCELPFADQSFETVFSNSTIEHVGSWERQLEFAQEARRVGRDLWIQTPAREFFFEPHLLTPWVHWASTDWQRRWLRRLALRSYFDGWTQQDVDQHIAEVRLISAEEMPLLFPDCEIIRERWFGRTKSYIAIRRA